MKGESYEKFCNLDININHDDDYIGFGNKNI